MSNKIGRFEILSELSHSDTGTIYKASDPEGEKTVVLKAIKLEPFGEQGPALVKTILEEAEGAKALNSPNIASIFSAEEIDGQLCAAMEYVQGNSVATMLARNEGFSIWDLQDIARQTCQGLDHAHAKHVFHSNLEPAKLMVAWDGTVKTLGFGTSSTGAYSSQASGKPAEVLHYMSPEQLGGDPVDARSNIFSLGAILYEMVTERKAFAGEDADQVRQSILETIPEAPDQINRKVHPVLSELIMKSLSKNPEERYPSGQELVLDLERCKDSPAKAASKAAAVKTATQVRGFTNTPPEKPAIPAVQPPTVKPTQTANPASVAATPAKIVAKAEPRKIASPEKIAAKSPEQVQAPKVPVEAVSKSESAAADFQPASQGDKKAAAAGWGVADTSFATTDAKQIPQADVSSPVHDVATNTSVEAVDHESAQMSAAPVIEPEEIEAPKIAVDPQMAENKSVGSAVRSFSEIDELPPLKEVYIASPPPTEPEPETETETTPEPVRVPRVASKAATAPDKPRIQPRQAAKRAVQEIKKTPLQLYGTSIGIALVIMLLIIAGIAYHIHSQSADDDNGPVQKASETTGQQNPAGAGAASQTPTETPAQAAEPITPETSDISVTPKYNKKKAVKEPVAPVIVPGQLTVNSTPEGALVAVDGQNSPGWVTPYNLAGVAPGQHTIAISKTGYTTETRTIEVASGSKSFLVVQLTLTAPVVSVSSVPAGAQILLDGKETGHVTPAQFSVDRPGNHTLLVRKQGYIEETTTANLQAGQTFQYGPSLRALGSTDDIKMGGKFKKIFGGGGNTSGMGTVSVKTQPKGAQVSVNQRVLDKNSPVEFYLSPGNYVIDITLSGYKSIHRVISVDPGGKVAIEESLPRE